MSKINFSNLKVKSLSKDDIEDIVSDNSMQIKKDSLIPKEDKDKITNFMLGLLILKYTDCFETNKIIYNNEFNKLRKVYKINPKKSQIYYMYRLYLYQTLILPNYQLEDLLITKRMRSQSGVLVISVIMPPDVFSCKYDCYYCPNDPKYSRSYFKGEPTVQRGERNGFDAYKQFYERAMSYFVNGHHLDKIELIILGGTFDCYNPNDSENFIKMLYYASNTIFDERSTLRDPKDSIEEEILINELSKCKIIGITIETRPDMISKHQLRRLRKYGVTRIQLGVQHTNDDILNKMNRQCSSEMTKKGIKLAKDNGFKIDIHLMPDLPGSNPDMDRAMFDEIIQNPDYQADQWKIYPTNILEFTKIKEWYDNGTYKPYAETHLDEFLKLLVDVMLKIPPYIRVNRIQRDFPGNYIEGGNKITNLRQVLDDMILKTGKISNDIRSMEVKFNTNNIYKARVIRLDYEASSGKEIFLSHKSCTCSICWKYKFFQLKQFLLNLFGINIYFKGCGNEDIIYSFLRLRISSENYENCFNEIMRNKGKIRELHVYGNKNATYDTNHNNSKYIQHFGFGKSLLKMAETISKEYKCNGTSVIAGVGTRNYYRKFGYEIGDGGFMIKAF
jgi:ELP3 family radical SAM enzyme/protein acetyltransferase